MATNKPAWASRILKVCATIGIAAMIAGGSAQATGELTLEQGVVAHDKIDVLYKRLSKAVATLDSASFTSVYASDVYYLPPDSPLVIGVENAAAHGWNGWFSWMKEGKGTLTMDFRVVAREVHDAMGYDIGYYKIHQVRPDEADVTYQGKLVVVTKRQADGEWRFQVDAFNDLKKDD